MASEVNFLPEELKPKKYAVKLSKKLRRIALVCLSVFFVTVLLYFASNFLFSYEQKKYKTDEDQLKSQIKALNSTEQSLVLAQDRLQKIAAIRSTSSATGNVQIAETILGKDLQGIVIDGFNLDRAQTVVAFTADNSQTLTRFFFQLLNSNFKNVKVTSFTFDIGKGYKVELRISG